MPRASNLNKTKVALQKALSAKRLDLDRVAVLTARLMEADNDRVRFSVDAGHIRRLGAELIGRTETALAELIKNAYDADATEVSVHFVGAVNEHGSVTVADNGSGMNREELISGFMRLSTPHKIEMPASPRFGRPRAGRKGIGRFAVQRLGEDVVLVTQQAQAKDAFQLELSWKRFESGMELGQVSSGLEKVVKVRPQGTILLVRELSDRWSETFIHETARQLRDVVLDQRPVKRHPDLETDPGMRITVQEDDNRIIDVQEMVEADFSRLALATVNGEIDEDGNIHWTLKSIRLAIDDTHDSVKDREGSRIRVREARNVMFSARYFIYEKGLLPPKELGRIQQLARRLGGVRVYRNGFRVLPYGEPGDDWLELDALSRQRSVLPAIANTNWFGRVELSDPEGSQFEETTSREGLLRTAAVDELRNVLRHVFVTVVNRVAAARGRKQRASDKGRRKKSTEALTAANELATELKRLAASLQKKQPKIASDVDRAATMATRTVEAVAGESAQAQQVLNELAMTRVLAAFGIVIGEFTHEARLRIQSLDFAVTQLESSVGAETLSIAVAGVREAIGPLRGLLGYFENAFGDQARHEMSVIELRDVIRLFKQTIDPDLVRLGIDLQVRFLGGSLFTIPMHNSEWVGILFNLYTNAKKAMQRRGDARTILVTAGRSGKELFVEFADTGDGIPEESWQKVFEPFVTTTARGDDSDDPSGLGLGLSIIRDITEGYGGRVAVVAPPTSFATAVRIWIPAAADKEIPIDAY